MAMMLSTSCQYGFVSPARCDFLGRTLFAFGAGPSLQSFVMALPVGRGALDCSGTEVDRDPTRDCEV